VSLNLAQKTSQATQPVGNAPEEFTAVLKMAIGRLDKLIRQTGLKLD
jgi:hypothetical protein